MKKLVLAFSLFNAFYGVLNAQEAVIANPNANILYVGFDNPIEIAVPNVSNDNIKVTISSGTIKKQRDGLYFIKLSESGETTITVEAKKKITKKRFAVRCIPEPAPRFGGFKDGFISLGEFQSANGMIAKTVNSVLPCTPTAQIDSYFVTIMSKGRLTYQVDVKGCCFLEDLIERFKVLQIGDAVIFTDIVAIYPCDNKFINLGTLSYIIK